MNETTNFENEYAPDFSIWSEDSTNITRLKKIIWDLPLPERRLIICYAECASLRKLAKQLGIGQTSCSKKIKQIKEKIIALYNGTFELADADNNCSHHN